MRFRTRCVLRPGRFIAALGAVACWPAWVSLAITCTWLLQMGAVAEWVIVWSLLLAAFGSVVVYVSGRSPSILGLTRAPIHRAFAPMVLGLLLMGAGVRWMGWQVWLVYVGGGTSLLVAGWHFELSRRLRAWPSGTLHFDGAGARLVTDGASYVLGDMPAGCLVGQWLTIPNPDLQPVQEGPYRSSRPVGHVPHALRGRGKELSRSLAMRGLGHAAFGLMSLIWAAL